MTLVTPDWWVGGWPDRELVVMDALQPMLNLIGVKDQDGNVVMDGSDPRHPQAVSWLPDGYVDKLPLVRCYRGGGASDRGALQDPASVQVAALCDTRAESWELIEICRQWLLSWNRGGTVKREDGSKTLVDCIEEINGPQLVPELNPDKRLVPLTFRVICRRPSGTPDYQVVREQLGL